MSMSDFQRSYLTSSYHNFEPYGVRTKKSLQKRNQIATYRHALPETLSFDVFFPIPYTYSAYINQILSEKSSRDKIEGGRGGGKARGRAGEGCQR